MCWRCNELSRRSLLAGGGVAAAALVAGSPRRASARPTWSR